MVTNYMSYSWGIYRVWTGAISYGTPDHVPHTVRTLTGAMNTLIKFIPNTVSAGQFRYAYHGAGSTAEGGLQPAG